MFKKTLLILSMTAFTALAVSAQDITTGTTGKADMFVKVSFDQIKAYDAAHPTDSVPKFKKPKPHWTPPAFPIDPSEIIYREPVREGDERVTMIREDSPAPDVDFEALGDNLSSIPPDTKGCVGPNHLMVTLNSEVRIQDKSGANLSTIDLSSFWSSLPGSNDAFDPQLMYDPYEERWIHVVVKASTPSASAVFVAASETSDPTGNWFQYSFDSDPTDYTWCDFPSVGFNKKWVVVSGNMFTSSNSFVQVALWVIDKEDLYAGVPDVDFTRLIQNNGFTIAPAMTYDPDLEDIFCVTNVTGNAGGDGFLRLFRITTGSLGNIIMVNEGLISSPDPWSDYYPQNNGNISPQLGSTQRIDAGDSRIRNTMYKNGSIWFTQNIFLPAGNPTRVSAQWWQTDGSGTVIQRGRVDDPSGTMFYSYSSLAVNGINDVLVGYSSFSLSQYASANYSFRTAGDPLSTLREPYLFKAGEAPYYKTYGGDRNRWGDFSATYVDPVNNLDFWTIQEYADSPANTWGTWWAKVKREAAPVPEFTANITTVPVTTGVNFTDASQFIPTSWLWTFEGGTPSTSTDQNPTNIIYNDEGTYDVTLTVTNNMGNNTITKEDYITASTTILPEVDFTVADTVVCIGYTITITDLTVYNPTEWMWEITPEGFSFANGTSASSQHPQIVFEVPGIYTVSLTATNPNGSTSLTKNNYLAAGGTPLSLEEDFESGFDERGWTIINPDNKVTWDIATIGGTTPGNKAARLDIRNYNSIRQRDQLISPPLDLSPYSSVTMTFKHAYAQFYPNVTDSLIVYISDDCQQTWTRLLELGEDGDGSFATHAPMSTTFVPQTVDDWCGAGTNAPCNYIDLTPWTGKTDVRIMFETFSFFGNNIYIDNIVIYNSVDIPQPEMELGLRVFPNPTTGMINIYVNDRDESLLMRIYNMQGQMIMNRLINPGDTYLALDLSGFPEGLYMMEFITSEAVVTRKLLLE